MSDSVSHRRSIDVVSKGYSNLFALHKNDLTKTLEDYPEAQKCFRNLARCMHTRTCFLLPELSCLGHYCRRNQKLLERRNASSFNLEEASKVSCALPIPKLLLAVSNIAKEQGIEGILETLTVDC